MSVSGAKTHLTCDFTPKTHFRILSIACLTASPEIAGHSIASFIDGFRRHYPTIPVIISGKESELAAHQDPHLIVLPSARLDRALEVAERVLQERAFKVEDVNPCRRCIKACGSAWPRRVMMYLLEDYHFLRIKRGRELADHFGVTEAYLDTVFNQECWLSVKQLLMALKLSAAAYLRASATLN